MNKQILIFNKWHDYFLKLENNLLSIHHSFTALNSGFEILLSLSLDQIILIQFNFKFENQFRSVSYLQTIKLR
jgi:hypothetical protein